jgi:hypothetical protein
MYIYENRDTYEYIECSLKIECHIIMVNILIRNVRIYLHMVNADITVLTLHNHLSATRLAFPKYKII